MENHETLSVSERIMGAYTTKKIPKCLDILKSEVKFGYLDFLQENSRTVRYSPTLYTLVSTLGISLIARLRKSDRCRICLSGCTSEFYVKTESSSHVSLDISCQRLNSVAYFLSYSRSLTADTQDLGRTRFTKFFMIENIEKGYVCLNQDCNPSLFKTVSNAFYSYCVNNGSLLDIRRELWIHNRKAQLKNDPDIWSALRTINSDIIVQCGETTQLETQLQLCPDFSIHFVELIKCGNWPIQIEAWFNRERVSGWPNEETRNEVIRAGCHIAVVPKSVDRKLMELSFAKAEQILVNSWNPTQQVVYHMLLFLYDVELQRFSTSGLGITSYHLKTLMLWKCEIAPPEYWQNPVISVCRDLLEELKQRLADRKFPHYFLDDFNMFEFKPSPGTDSFANSGRIVTGLALHLETKLCPGDKLEQWFQKHYLQQKSSMDNITETSENTSQTDVAGTDSGKDSVCASFK